MNEIDKQWLRDLKAIVAVLAFEAAVIYVFVMRGAL